AAQLNDIASTLGGELTISADGPLLPTPSWKVAIEVNDPVRLQTSLEQLAKQFEGKIEATSVNRRTYYTVTSSRIAYEVDYVFTDGYLLIAPSQALLTSAINGRASGATLPRSSAFRGQLPQDGHLNFSALLYYNMGSQVGPVFDQLKGLMTADQQKSAGM